MVIEGKPGEIIGYACAAPDIRTFQRRSEREWAPRMRRKYPPALMNAQSTLEALAKVIHFYNTHRYSYFENLIQYFSYF